MQLCLLHFYPLVESESASHIHLSASLFPLLLAVIFMDCLQGHTVSQRAPIKPIASVLLALQ